MGGGNEGVIAELYSAFGRHDGRAMAALYAAGACFSDPVFTDLRGDEPGLMWRMLTERAEDLEIELLEHEADGERGSAHWLAHYTFTETGRRVDNDVRASFRFEGGKIAEHRDEFSFYGWTRQALGPVGLALGWTPIIQGTVRRKARAGLEDYIARERADAEPAPDDADG